MEVGGRYIGTDGRAERTHRTVGVDVENGMGGLHEDCGGNVGEMIVIKKVGGYLTHSCLADTYRPLQSRLTERLADKTLRVVGGKRLFVSRFHDGCTLAFPIAKIVSSSEAAARRIRLHAALDCLGGFSDEALQARGAILSAHDLEGLVARFFQFLEPIRNSRREAGGRRAPVKTSCEEQWGVLSYFAEVFI